MKAKRMKTSALLMLPSLTVLAASLQAADVSPIWVEYTPTTTSPAGDTPATAKPAVAPAADAATPAVAAPPPPASAAVPVTGNEQATQATASTANSSAASPAGNGMTTSSSITPRIFAFDYFKGAGENLTHYLERYDYRDGMTGDRRSGAFADVDISLNMNNGDRDVFVIERKGFGQDNHRGMARFDDDEMALSGSYNHYRSATGGIDYLFSPDVVADTAVFSTAIYPGGTPAGTLQIDSDPGTTDFHIDRTRYAASFKVKPTLLGGSVSLAADYEGYKREGKQFASSIVMAGGGLVGAWRGINLAIDERMNKFGFSLSASPRKLFNVAYNVSLEKFTNQAPDLSRNDIMGTAGSNRQSLSPFYFVPDTSLITQGLQVSKTFGERGVLAAGYNYSTLKDESSPERFTTGFGGDGGPDAWEGEINSSSAYLTGTANVSPAVSVDGHIKYANRQNDSSFPVEHVISLSGTGRMTGPRINSIESMNYGLSANWRPGVMHSNVTLGWQRIDTERDLTYRTTAEAIPAERILYRENSLSDEAYIKLMAVPAPGVTLRLNPSYLWSDKVGLVTEPEEALQVKTMLSYASPSGWLASGYYDYKHKQNNGLTYIGAGANTATQDVDDTFHSAGISLNVMPRESLNTSLSLFWMQNDFASYFLSTSDVRSAAGATFSSFGTSNYKIDSYGVTLGADWQTNEKLKLSGNYTFTRNKGDTASGEVLLALQDATGTIDSRLDNTLHSVSLGADYTLTPKATLRANYIYDYYDDSAYGLLTGGVNMLAIGVSFEM